VDELLGGSGSVISCLLSLLFSRLESGEVERENTLTRKPRRAMKERVPPRQMGSIAMSKGPYLEPISSVVCDTSNHQPSEEYQNR